MNVSTKHLVSILLPNLPGQLARLTTKLAEEKVNILGIYAEEGAGETIVNLVMEPHERGMGIIKELGIEIIEERDILCVLHDNSKPGDIAEIATRLTNANINIRSIFGAESITSSEVVEYLDTSDNQKAFEVLSAK